MDKIYKKLNEKQNKFCEYFVIDYNPEKSAIKAGYNKLGARNTAWRLLKEPHIIRRINKLKDENIDLSQFMSLTDIINYHVKILTAKQENFIEFGTKIINGNKVNYSYFKNSKNLDTTAIKSISYGKDGAKVELVDKKQSIEYLTKLFDKFKLDQNIDFETIEELKTYLSKLLSKSCELSDTTLKNQLAITSKIAELLDQNENIDEINNLVDKFLENNESSDDL